MTAIVVFPFWILGAILGIGSVIAHLAAWPGKATSRKLVTYATVSSVSVAIVVGHSLLPHFFG